MSDEHAMHHVNYLAVFIALCILTGLSVTFDVVEIRGKTIFGIFNGTILLIFLVLGVAVAKALCVMAFFMHLKFEGRWKYVLLSPTIILAIGIPLALLPDIGLHYYFVDIPQNERSVSVSHHGENEQSTENNGH